MTVEATVALLVGFTTRSVSLQGFGIDSLIELLAGAFCSGGSSSKHEAERLIGLNVRNGVPPG
jgi:hypothetical protein